MGNFLTKQMVLLAKEESAYANDASPTVAANALEALNVKVKPVGDVLERNQVRNDLSPVGALIGQRYVEVSFDLEIKGGGTKGTAARLGDLLEACGFGETASAGSSVTYKPTSTSIKSVTLYVYEISSASGNVRLHKILGARGNLKISAEAGQIGKFEFMMRGVDGGMTDVSAPSAPTYETTVPPIIESSVFTLNSVTSLVAQKVEVDMQNSLALQDDISSAAGVKGFLITGRKPTGSFNPEAVLAATYDFRTDWKNATQRALSMVIGSAAGNKLTISAPKLLLTGIESGDRNGQLTEELSFALARNSGNDEIELKFE